MTSTVVQNWLRQNVQPYPRHERVYADADTALSAYTTLRVKTDVYTYDDGRQQLLLCLHGVLPISFQRTSYNIPIQIWTPLGYPNEVPIVYVVPNSEMLVRKSEVVDPSGRCFFPYMSAWEKKKEGCSLRALLEVMQDYFSREPPLYARPKQPRANPAATPSATLSTPVASTSYSPPVPPRPGGDGPPIAPPRPLSVSSPGYRPPPPLPTATPPPPAAGHNNALAQPPPPPPVHGRTLSVHPTELARAATAGYTHRYSLQTPGTPPPAPPPISIQHPGHIPHHPVQPWVPPSVPQSITQQPSTISPPPPRYMHMQSLPAAPQPPLVAPTPIPDLMDADDSQLPAAPAPPPQVAAPPRPPNPELIALHARLYEKFTTELASLTASVEQENKRLRGAQADLLKGEPAVRDEMARLEAVRDVCQTVRGQLAGVVNSAENAIANLERKGDPEVDELVCATSIVHNQLINLVAEDNAIEDTIYHLHRALNAGKLDLEKFLKTTRQLAEEQFMKRALIEKITSQLPMGLRM